MVCVQMAWRTILQSRKFNGDLDSQFCFEVPSCHNYRFHGTLPPLTGVVWMCVIVNLMSVCSSVFGKSLKNINHSLQNMQLKSLISAEIIDTTSLCFLPLSVIFPLCEGRKGSRNENLCCSFSHTIKFSNDQDAVWHNWCFSSSV